MSKERIPRTDLAGYFAGISARLKIQTESMSPVFVHSGEMGDNDHYWFSDILRGYLPTRIGVDTGFVVNCHSDHGSRSHFHENKGSRYEDQSIGPQNDILILDVLDNAPFCSEKTFRVCPIEMVLGVVEVTRFLTPQKLKVDVQKIARVRKLAEVKRYVIPKINSDESELASSLRPRGYIVGLSGQLTLDNIIDVIEPVPDDLRPNAILLLDSALYVRKPFTTDFARIEENVLFSFISMFRNQVESFPRGRTDLESYLPSIPMFFGRDNGQIQCLDGDDEDLDEYASGTGP